MRQWVPRVRGITDSAVYVFSGGDSGLNFGSSNHGNTNWRGTISAAGEFYHTVVRD